MPKVAGFKSFTGALLDYSWLVLLLAGLMPLLAGGIGASVNAGESESGSSGNGEFSELQHNYQQLKYELNNLRELQSTDNGAANSLRSAGNNANIKIGGEINVDYIASWQGRGSEHNPAQINAAGWQLHSTNLRFNIAFENNIHAYIKLDFSQKQDYLEQQLLEEARLVWENIGGGPIGVFFGKGEVPYGQDRTLGIIQSYNHTEGSYSSEGPTILSGPNYSQSFNSAYALSPVFHPGEIDRVLMAGISLSWQDMIRFELAVFQPTDWTAPSIGDGTPVIDDFGLESISARLWWNTPIEGLVAEISGVRKHIKQRGNRAVYGNDAVENEYAMSIGADWKLCSLPLELFAEYQHGWDWNFTSGYDTNTLSVGGIYDYSTQLRFGAMLEWLRIDDRGTAYNYNKFVFHTKYTFDNGVYTMAEYGFETYNWGSANTHMLAIRSGVRF